MSSESPGVPRPLALLADQGVLVGFSRVTPDKHVLARDRHRSQAPVGNLVLYDGTTIGRRLETGHGVVIREEL